MNLAVAAANKLRESQGIPLANISREELPKTSEIKAVKSDWKAKNQWCRRAEVSEAMMRRAKLLGRELCEGTAYNYADLIKDADWFEKDAELIALRRRWWLAIKREMGRMTTAQIGKIANRSQASVSRGMSIARKAEQNVGNK